MKKTTWIIWFFLSIMVACSSDTPKDIAEDFLDALSKKKFEKAKTYVTPESMAIIDMFAQYPDQTNIPSDFKVTSEETLSDTEVIVSYEATVNSVKKTETMQLKKIDGKWKVQLKLNKK
jgi:hypothetical protein